MLAEHADFHVNINSVVGGGIAHPGRRLHRLAARPGPWLFLHHRHHPRWFRPVEAPRCRNERDVWDRVRKLTRRSYSRFNHFQEAIANGQPNDWRCRAGSRYLYICEFGLVHYCSQQRGYPGVPLATYRTADVKREFLTEKSCAPNCTISCVHQVSYIDHWRAPQHAEVDPPAAGHTETPHPELVQIR